VVGFALKFFSQCGEDLWDCILRVNYFKYVEHVLLVIDARVSLMISACSLSLVHTQHLSWVSHYSIQDGKDDFLLPSTHIRKVDQPFSAEGRS
jgi:hypothetical protein